MGGQTCTPVDKLRLEKGVSDPAGVQRRKAPADNVGPGKNSAACAPHHDVRRAPGPSRTFKWPILPRGSATETKTLGINNFLDGSVPGTRGFPSEYGCPKGTNRLVPQRVAPPQKVVDHLLASLFILNLFPKRAMRSTNRRQCAASSSFQKRIPHVHVCSASTRMLQGCTSHCPRSRFHQQRMCRHAIRICMRRSLAGHVQVHNTKWWARPLCGATGHWPPDCCGQSTTCATHGKLPKPQSHCACPLFVGSRLKISENMRRYAHQRPAFSYTPTAAMMRRSGRRQSNPPRTSSRASRTSRPLRPLTIAGNSSGPVNDNYAPSSPPKMADVPSPIANVHPHPRE